MSLVRPRTHKFMSLLKAHSFRKSVCGPLTPSLGVNFTNILRARFTYESKLCSYSLITYRLWDFLAKGYRQKTRAYNVCEIDPWWNKKRIRERERGGEKERERERLSERKREMRKRHLLTVRAISQPPLSFCFYYNSLSLSLTHTHTHTHTRSLTPSICC